VKVDVTGFLKYLFFQEVSTRNVRMWLGRLKGETGVRYHTMILARVTNSGLEPGKWADRLGEPLQRRSIRNGFVFHNTKENNLGLVTT
jgi:hypothetical protein